MSSESTQINILTDPHAIVPRIPPPPNIAPRHEPYDKILDHLDTNFDSLYPNGPAFFDTPNILRQGRGDGKVDAEGVWVRENRGRMEREGMREVEVGEVSERVVKEQAVKMWEEARRAREGFVGLACERLQASMGVRNELAFELPGTTGPRLPKYLASELFIPPLPDEFDPSNLKQTVLSSDYQIPVSQERGKDSQNSLRHSLLNKSLPKTVHPVTGQGLRDWLVSKGKLYGTERKLNLTSISMYDTTPTGMGESSENALVAHFAKDILGVDRLEMYEVDVPVEVQNTDTGEITTVKESWVWFLIQKPLCTIDYYNRSTVPPRNRRVPQRSYMNDLCEMQSKSDSSTSASRSSPPTSQDFNDQTDKSHILNSPSGYPPNFPRSINSYAVFACPSANIGQGPVVTESTQSTSFPGAPRILSHQRRDFDFSTQGIPLFELTGNTVFGGGSEDQNLNGNNIQFLSVDGIGPWCQGDGWREMSDEVYRRVWRRFEARFAGNGEMDMGDEWWERRGKYDAEGRRREFERDERFEFPSPYEGIWWDQFYKLMYADAQKWKDIRKAMGRNALRVVIRWTESVPIPMPTQPNASSSLAGPMRTIDIPPSLRRRPYPQPHRPVADSPLMQPAPARSSTSLLAGGGGTSDVEMGNTPTPRPTNIRKSNHPIITISPDTRPYPISPTQIPSPHNPTSSLAFGPPIPSIPARRPRAYLSRQASGAGFVDVKDYENAVVRNGRGVLRDLGLGGLIGPVRREEREVQGLEGGEELTDRGESQDVEESTDQGESQDVDEEMVMMTDG